MSLRAFLRRDLQLLFSDPKGLALTFALPVIVAILSGWAFSGMGKKPDDGPAEPRIRLLLVDEDGTPPTRRLVERIGRIEGVGVEELPVAAGPEHREGRERAHDAIRLGTRPAALLIPPGTGARIEAGLFGAAMAGGPPTLTLWVDPSRQAEVGMLQGALYRAAMEVVAADSFSRTGGRRQLERLMRQLGDDADVPDAERTELQRFFARGLEFMDAIPEAQPGDAGGGAADARNPFAGGMPEPVRFAVETVSAGGGESSPFAGYDGYAHAFAGMGVMFLLFGVLEGGLFLIRERHRGTLARVVASPTAPHTVLVAQSLFGIGLGVAQLALMLAIAHLLFGVRVVGSWPGLVCVVVAASAAAAGFGLCIAAFFRTERQAQPVAILIILVTSALGGSWWPLFVTPQLMQDLASVTITKWAVGGMEGALWRGWSFGDMAPSALILLGMATALHALAWWRFRYE